MWPQTDAKAVDNSICYHACKFVEARSELVDLPVTSIVQKLERIYAETKVIWDGWPKDFERFVREAVDWDASPGWPWRKAYPTNRDLFLFDGVRCDKSRVDMVEESVKRRWSGLLENPESDPIYCFVKQEPHKISKADKKAWRLISGVGLTDTLVDRILYGKWLQSMIDFWPQIPSKAGWSPQQGGFRWMAKSFRGKIPVSIDKSAWDWTVNRWHIDIIEQLVPRMLFRIDDDWKRVFKHRIYSMYYTGFPLFKLACGCCYRQLVTGIQKSGCLGTIAFNSIWQIAAHLASGGLETDLIYSLGDDTVQELNYGEDYLVRLRRTGALIKEVDIGTPIKFGGHVFDLDTCVPAYRAKHMYNLYYLDDRFAKETLDSYRHLYALDERVSHYLEELVLKLVGCQGVMSREYLREWYMALE